MRLKERVALITGAGSGIGRATAVRFAAEGAAVAVLDRNAESSAATAESIRAIGGEAVALAVDVANAEDLKAAVEYAADRFGRLDIVMNNAATYVPKTFDDISTEEWRLVLDTNLMAYFICARTAAARMRASGWGSIVNIASAHAKISMLRSGAYAASKGAVVQLTRNLAIEYAPEIAVNSISPGYIRTAMSVKDGVDETTTAEFSKCFVDSGRIPLRRAGLPEEIAAAALFLAARECAYLTGADITVDGGLTTTI